MHEVEVEVLETYRATKKTRLLVYPHIAKMQAELSSGTRWFLHYKNTELNQRCGSGLRVCR